MSRRPATEPYWAAGVYRFDAPQPLRAGAFDTCYAASTIDVAFAETVIHEAGRFVAGSHEVPAAELTERSVVRFRCERRKMLVLADLTGKALKSLGLNNDISASNDYAVAQVILARGELGRHSIRFTTDEQGLRLRDLRAQRAGKTQSRQAQGAASLRALRSVQRHCGVMARSAEPECRQPGEDRLATEAF